MPRRVKPVALIGLIATLVLSIALWAGANTGGGSRDAAVGAAMGQVGMPYAFGTDGPSTFSCVGLVRHALRSAGVDPNAPWDHMAYLGAYPTVSNPQPGDVVVYPDGVAMYIGNDQIVMANEVDQVVGTYGMNEVGTPVGFASPYSGSGTLDPVASDPAVVDETTAFDETAVEPVLEDPAAFDPALVDPTLVDPTLVDPTLVDPTLVDPTLVDPVVLDETAVDPIAIDPALEDPALVDPAAVDPMMF